MSWDPRQHEADLPPGAAVSLSAGGFPDPEESLYLRGLVMGMRCGIVTVDQAGRIRLVNRLAQEILALEDAAPGAPMDVVLARHPRLVEVLGEAFRMASLPNRAEIELGEGNGGGKTIGFTLSLVRGESGDPRGVAMFFKDLTQIELREEQERLKDRLAALGQMAASLAHEIRNPLASIEVTCSLLKRRVGDDPDGLGLLERIVSEVRRLNQTVTSGLEFVRPVDLNLESTPLIPVIEEAIAVATGRRGRPGTDLVRRFDEGIPPFLMDRCLLRQVFENLLLNAMEAVDSTGQVTVTTEVTDAPAEASVPYRPSECAPVDNWPRADQFVVVRVADTGSGIDADDLDRIFYPLYTTKKQGSGIGLAVVRKIVNSHHGLIDVESTPGAGAEFSIRLPMALPTAEVPGR